MFELTETIDIEHIDQNKNILKGGNKKEFGELIKGGFPRIRICDEEFLRKIDERKPREFSNDKIISIKQLLEKKKTQIEDPFINIAESLNIISGGEDTSRSKKINGISIDAIIGKK
jgi:hypothetical protein